MGSDEFPRTAGESEKYPREHKLLKREEEPKNKSGKSPERQTETLGCHDEISRTMSIVSHASKKSFGPNLAIWRPLVTFT